MKAEACSFWCSKCKIVHPGECPPGTYPDPVAATWRHDWEALPVIDLSNVSVCRRCFLRHRDSLVDALSGQGKPRPVDGCPKKPV
jgi:hypothetical protein